MSATLGAQSVKSATVNIPKRGQSRAEVTLEGGVAPSGKLTLTIADLAIVATVIPGRTGLDSSYAPACVLLSGYGWETPLPSPPPSWQSDAGVPIRTVIERLARIAGETIDPATTPAANVRLGAACVLSAGTCGQALDALALRGYVPPWWVAPDGVTHFGDRPTGTANPLLFEVSRNDSMFGVRRVHLTTSARCILPGNTIEGVVISRVVFTLTPAELTARTWA